MTWQQNKKEHLKIYNYSQICTYLQLLQLGLHSYPVPLRLEFSWIVELERPPCPCGLLAHDPLIKELGLLIGHLDAWHIFEMLLELITLFSPEIGLEGGDMVGELDSLAGAVHGLSSIVQDNWSWTVGNRDLHAHFIQSRCNLSLK